MSGMYLFSDRITDKAALEPHFLRIATVGFSALFLLSISACTSSNGGPSFTKPTIEDALSSAAQVGSDGETIVDPELSALNEIPKNVPVPVSSPNYQTALLAEGSSLSSGSESALAAKSVAIDTSSNTTESMAATATTSSTTDSKALGPTVGGDSVPSGSTANESINNAKIASVNTKAPTIGSGTINVDNTATKNVVEPKLNFFQRLLKANKERLAAKALADKEKALKEREVKLARSVAASANRSGNKAGLPGVKKGIKIFGINEESNHDDDSNVKVASVGALGRTAGAHGLILQTQHVQVSCFKPELLQILKRVERHYGRKVMVTSGYRSPARNRRAGGVKNSTHTYCKAADIQVQGISKWNLAKYLRAIDGRGGVGTYCRTKSVHIDVGSQRDWHHPCRRRTKRKKRKS